MPNPLGKIWHLPLAVREELNQRMLEHQVTDVILAWLNGLPETIALCEAAGCEPVTARNLSLWRLGGHADWLNRRERGQKTKSLCEWTAQFNGLGDGKFTEGISTLMAEQLFEVMEGLAKAQQEINGMEDEAARTVKWMEISKTVAEVARALASMRGGDHEREKLLLGERALKQKDEWMALHREKFQRLVCARLLDDSQRAKIHQIAMSDAEYELKLEAIRKVAFADVDEVERSGLVDKLLPP